ncbi:hypothetical protein T07_13856 [Trichinella nelsoni]|uniref:Uncharacterized protein n=1 Tax=Trichinella nelsoni TaxID=6336 RepID=A0A0V0SAV5_9BILA|nr:hypothetical protein T07_13856 [Trichinella nelsoni]
MASEKNIPTEMPTKANGTEGVKQIPDDEQSSSVDQEDQREHAQMWTADIPAAEHLQPTLLPPLVSPKEVKSFQPQIISPAS